ncbi:hypothetical protein F5Y19DRAFT_473189 [Xylariaceae sp. FL1651]|nr:hypothetical protein F5Y19DRAFT_473189 [Xylariaceae sp. FL1651]
MKSNIKLTVYLTTAIMSEVLAKALAPAGLAGIYDATFTRVTYTRNEITVSNVEPLCDLGDIALTSNGPTSPYYCFRDAYDVGDLVVLVRPLPDTARRGFDRMLTKSTNLATELAHEIKAPRNCNRKSKESKIIRKWFYFAQSYM